MARVTTAGQSAEQLAAVLAAIDAGEITATDVQRAYIAGAADALAALEDPPD